MAELLAASLAICLTRREYVDAPALVRREFEDQKHIFTNVISVNYLLNSHETDNVMHKAASKMDSWMRFCNQTAVQFDEAPRNKAL